MKKLQVVLAVLLLCWFLPLYAQDQNTNNDPFEKYNREMFGFNQGLDAMVLKPAAEGYTKIVPIPLQKGFNNFFNNVGEVPTIINDVLQGNLYHTVGDTWRLIINTTLGIGGLFDVATKLGIPPHDEDFGLTMAKWGWTNSNSPYFILPFLGPSSARDAFALPFNYYLMSLWPYIKPYPVRYGLIALRIISIRAEFLHYSDFMQQMSLDPYIFQKNAYEQRREMLIKKNNMTRAEMEAETRAYYED